MKFSPDYVRLVLNENFEDAKAQFLAPLMAIHHAHLVAHLDRQDWSAKRQLHLDLPRRLDEDLLDAFHPSVKAKRGSQFLRKSVFENADLLGQTTQILNFLEEFRDG